MISDLRRKFNEAFTQERYEQFLEFISAQYNHTPAFRIAESPVFVPDYLKAHLFKACEDIASVIADPSFKELSEGAMRPDYQIPNEDDHTLFLQLDFGVTYDENGKLFPKLIEIQGFPSLYFYQDLVARAYREFFDIPAGMSHLFGGRTTEDYLELLRRLIIGDEDPKQVVLLEIEPFQQVTQIDFLGARAELGLHIACISELKRRGRTVYYKNDQGKEIEVRRIFNRVIFDELFQRTDLKREFKFIDDIDVDWVGHPNWFFRISKHTLPLLDSEYVPKTWYLDSFEQFPEDLDNYVLKPLYSFAGSGVIIDLTQEELLARKDPENYILQEKVLYQPVIQTLDEPSKCEIRMLMLWEDGVKKPVIVNNLARLSKGKMIGVKYNKNKTWVGGSVAFFNC